MCIYISNSSNHKFDLDLHSFSPINYSSAELELYSDKKGVKIISDNRYTKITIDKNFKSENENETFISTHIIKDKLLKTTETFIKKVFIHKTKEGPANVIIREINIDRYKNQSVSENKSIRVKLDHNESLEEKISSFLQLNPPQLLLN